MKRKLGWFVVVFLISSCGNYGHWKVEWPTSLIEVSNFSENQKNAVLSAVDELNTRAGKTLITNGSGQSDLIITWVQSIPKAATYIAGRATLEGNRCIIEITEAVAQSDELLKPVLWHEIGHCAGLDHDPTRGTIMYREATPLSDLTAEIIDSFFAQIAASTN